MGKSHKRARRSEGLSSHSAPSAPKVHDWEKDDEELELEARLFGASKKRSNGHSGLVAQLGRREDDEVPEEMRDMADDELFTIDAPEINGGVSDDDAGGPVYDENDEGTEQEEGDLRDSDEAASGEEEEDEEEEEDASSVAGPSFRPRSSSSDDHYHLDEDGDDAPVITVASGVIDPAEEEERPKSKKQALWTDPADDLINVDLDGDRRLKKLGRGKGGGTVSGKELEKRLRHQFEALHPRPAWAAMRQPVGTPSLTSLLSSTKSFIDSPTTNGKSKDSARQRGPLAQGVISMMRQKDANHQNPTAGKGKTSDAAGGVVGVVWHPNPQVGVMGVAGGDRRVRFFHIDGHSNPALLTLHIPSLPLACPTFHPSGTQVLLTGPRPFYYSYDLAAQRITRSPRNLFGSAPENSAPNTLAKHAFSPDGKLLAVAGRRGHVSVLEWHKGAGAVVSELKSGRGGAIGSLLWTSGRELSVLGGRDGTEVEVWDVGEKKIVRKWSDERMFGGETMRESADGRYTAVGSSTGIVSLYSTQDLRSSSKAKQLPLLRPEPVKSLEHLTTAISQLTFHPSGELLASSSASKPGAMRLYHLPSATAYSNWPRDTTPLGRVTSVTFNPYGNYMAVGNQRGKVLLWSLKHFSPE